MNVLGIMSGTSLGSVDYALCEIIKSRLKLLERWEVDYPKPLQEKLHCAARGDLASWDFCQLHHDLGRFYAHHASRITNHAPALVGLHGQTVFHNPNQKNPATFQLGEPSYLVEKLRVPVVNNFRVADLAAGGQGAPLANLFHQHVFAERGQHVCLNNLGGISNVTSIDWRNNVLPCVPPAGEKRKFPRTPASETHGSTLAREPKILAFDTGPANMLVDFTLRHFTKCKVDFDRDGAWAARGKPSETLLEKWLAHPYFKQTPPKSTGRELFGEPFFREALPQMRKLSKYDVAATFTEFTARSLALNYQLHLGSVPDKVILMGGGASNPILVEKIHKHLLALPPKTTLQKCEVVLLTSDQVGWPVQAIEPAAFALLAYLRLHKQPGNIPETTGANRPVLCGQISEP